MIARRVLLLGGGAPSPWGEGWGEGDGISCNRLHAGNRQENSPLQNDPHEEDRPGLRDPRSSRRRGRSAGRADGGDARRRPAARRGGGAGGAARHRVRRHRDRRHQADDRRGGPRGLPHLGSRRPPAGADRRHRGEGAAPGGARRPRPPGAPRPRRRGARVVAGGPRLCPGRPPAQARAERRPDHPVQRAGPGGAGLHGRGAGAERGRGESRLRHDAARLHPDLCADRGCRLLHLDAGRRDRGRELRRADLRHAPRSRPAGGLGLCGRDRHRTHPRRPAGPLHRGHLSRPRIRGPGHRRLPAGRDPRQRRQLRHGRAIRAAARPHAAPGDDDDGEDRAHVARERAGRPAPGGCAAREDASSCSPPAARRPCGVG